jgi:Tfp pilus assembly protein PilW
MNKPTKPMNKQTKPITNDKQRGFGVVELLFAATTLGAAVLVAAMSIAKRPIMGGD